MLTWKSHRPPLREHFSFQANVATFLLWTIQRASARLRVVRCGSKRVRSGPMLTWKSHRSPPLKFQANIATFIQRADARSRARARLRVCTLRQ